MFVSFAHLRTYYLALCKTYTYKMTFQIEGGGKKNPLVSTSVCRGCGCLGGTVGGGELYSDAITCTFCSLY